MACAKKCDRCGKLYEQYNSKNDKKNPNGIMVLNLDSQRRYFTHNALDLCPDCMKGFQDWFREVKQMSKKVKCCECASFLGWALPERVDKDNYEYAKSVFKLASTTGVCAYSMKTKQMAHEQYCKRFEKNKYLEQEREPFKQEILNLKNAIAEYEKENFVEVDESWKALFMKRFQEVKQMERLTERVYDGLIIIKQDSGDEGNYKAADKLAHL